MHHRAPPRLQTATTAVHRHVSPQLRTALPIAMVSLAAAGRHAPQHRVATHRAAAPAAMSAAVQVLRAASVHRAVSVQVPLAAAVLVHPAAVVVLLAAAAVLLAAAAADISEAVDKSPSEFEYSDLGVGHLLNLAHLFSIIYCLDGFVDNAMSYGQHLLSWISLLDVGDEFASPG